MKVSVVVATYNSPPELDELVASLDAQSMPSNEFEVVLVDDGSSDETYGRIAAIAAARSNVTAIEIPNSGWPGRPRNVGIRAASGEYVFFADHDDYLFPEAVERMYDFASVNDLDVVHPKEVVHGSGAPQWVTWREQVPRIAQLDHVALHCLSPHKLYRRAFLLENDIWFPEGRVRLEDFRFNALAWARTDAVGLLADYPCYRWHLHPASTSKKNPYPHEYWPSFRRSMEPISLLPDGPKKDQLLARWYHARPLVRVKKLHSSTPASAERSLQALRDLVPLFPTHVDALLTPADRARSALFRQGDVDAMVELARLDHQVHLAVRDLSLRWSEGRLELSLTADIVNADGRPFALGTPDGGVRRAVPESLRTRLGDDVLDLTEDVKRAFGEVVLRSRADSVDWIIPSRSSLEVVQQDEGALIRMKLSTAIDPRTAAFGRPLSHDVWDVFVRVDGLGYTGTDRLSAGDLDRSVALVDGQVAVVRRTPAGTVVLDLTGDARPLMQEARPTPAHLTRSGTGSALELPGIHVSGPPVEGWLSVGGRRLPARLLSEKGRPLLRTTEPLVGPGKVRMHLLGRTSRILFELDGAAERGTSPLRRVSRAVKRVLAD